MKDNGFTIFELVITLSISSILALTAIPKFEEIQASYHRFNSRSFLIQDLRRAQAFTLSEGCRGILTVASDKKRYSFGCDYLTYDTSNPPSPDSVSFEREMPVGITIELSQTIIFNSRGESVDADGIVSSVPISLVDSRAVDSSSFADGTLLGTGLFNFY
jgi:prepilin-type N-terminal cleavage/methylation domain-containing protein